jgi:hypothetical protein
MNFLFDIYGFSYPMVWLSDSRQRFRRWDPNLEAEMFVIAAWTALSTAGIAFYVRFLVALQKERKPRLIGYWVRLRLGAREDTIAELRERGSGVRQTG